MEHRACLNLATLSHLGYEAQLQTAARAGFRAVGLRANTIEDALASGRTLPEARALLDSLGLAAPEMNFFPDWIYTRGEAREAALARFARLCELSEALGSPVIICTTGCEGTPDDTLARENYAELCRMAGARGLVAGLEFLPWTAVRTVADAWRLVERVHHEAAAVVLDSFHVVKGRSRMEDIRGLPPEKIAIVHVNDLLETGEDVITLCRRRRVLPGEGQFPLPEFVEAVRATGYAGWYALEILNEGYPKEDPDTVARRSFASMKALLGEAP